MVKGFFEDYDGEMVLGDIRNFNNEDDFLEKAKDYIKETRGFRIPVLNPSKTEIVFNDEEWQPADTVKQNEFEGERITVYVSNLDWENAETRT